MIVYLNKHMLHDKTAASSDTHNLKLDRKSHFTTFACKFGRFRFTRLLFRVAPTGDMSQRKIDKIFKGLPNIFGIADDIFIIGYDDDSKDHDRTMSWLM